MAAEAERRVDAEALRALVGQIFERSGMDEPDAGLLAETLVAADRRGVHSHGVIRVPEYVKKLTRDGVDPRGRPRVVRRVGGCLVVDGGNAMGQVAARFAMAEAIAAAEEHGLAAAAIRGSNHCGAMAYFAMQALERDMIGIATTNALPTMAPWGGAERLLGINPLAVAIPAGRERPIVYDAAFSGSAHGKIRVYAQRGQPIPEGWALDRAGRPTTDPLEAIDGLLLPTGGFKGAGLALVMGVLSSMLSGAAYGTELGDMARGPTAGQDGHFVMALKVGAFEDVARFKERVDRAVRQIHACRLAPGFEAVYAPGELEFWREEEYRRDGVPLNAVTLADLGAVAAELGLEAAALTR
jgi:LDH2 family malate/lactate/ureidoglycolate dehydrogenase